MTRLNDYWASKFHMYMGYRAVEDYDDLRAFNRFIKAVRQTKHTPKKKVTPMQSNNTPRH